MRFCACGLERGCAPQDSYRDSYRDSYYSGNKVWAKPGDLGVNVGPGDFIAKSFWNQQKLISMFSF